MRETRLSRTKHSVDRTLGWILAGFMALAVFNVLWQVFTRYVLQSPSAYTDELARYVLIWIGLLGGAYAAGRRMHLAIDLLPNRLRGRQQAVLGLAIEGLIAGFALVVMVFGGMRLVTLTLMLEQTSAALQIPLGYVYIGLPLSGCLIIFYCIVFMVDHVHQLRGQPVELVETTERVADAFTAGIDSAADTATTDGTGGDTTGLRQET